MKILFNYLVFPGIMSALAAGIIASWIERKVTARVQWRVGPPLLQPLYDIMKLFIKENVIPENANAATFFAAPLISFACAGLAATLAGMAAFYPSSGFTGDVFVMVYLLTIPPLAVVMGGAASANPLASLGSSREMKLILSYELVFWISIVVVLVKTGGVTGMAAIMSHSSAPAAWSVSGAIAFVLALVSMQAKLGRVPFDVAEAETEITSGPYIEYSGPLLGFFKMSQFLLLVALPLFISEIFLGKANALKYVVLLVVVILAENTNPRLKITQCLRLFWFILFPLSIIALILALAGL